MISSRSKIILDHQLLCTGSMLGYLLNFASTQDHSQTSIFMASSYMASSLHSPKVAQIMNLLKAQQSLFMVLSRYGSKMPQTMNSSRSKIILDHQPLCPGSLLGGLLNFASTQDLSQTLTFMAQRCPKPYGLKSLWLKRVQTMNFSRSKMILDHKVLCPGSLFRRFAQLCINSRFQPNINLHGLKVGKP